MNQAIKIGAIGAAALLLFRYLTGRKKSAQNLKIVPIDIAIDKGKTQADAYTNLHYKVKLKLINQEQAPVIVTAVDFDVYYQNRKIAKLFTDQGFEVQGRQTKNFLINGSIGTGSVINSIIELLTGTNKKVGLTIDGHIDTDLGRIPVSFSKEIAF
jgi:LEA14-like dessication related protein